MAWPSSSNTLNDQAARRRRDAERRAGRRDAGDAGRERRQPDDRPAVDRASDRVADAVGLGDEATVAAVGRYLRAQVLALQETRESASPSRVASRAAPGAAGRLERVEVRAEALGDEHDRSPSGVNAGSRSANGSAVSCSTAPVSIATLIQIDQAAAVAADDDRLAVRRKRRVQHSSSPSSAISRDDAGRDRGSKSAITGGRRGRPRSRASCRPGSTRRPSSGTRGCRSADRSPTASSFRWILPVAASARYSSTENRSLSEKNAICLPSGLTRGPTL